MDKEELKTELEVFRDQLRELITYYEKDMVKLDSLIHELFLKDLGYDEMKATGQKIMLKKVVGDLKEVLK